MPSGTASLPSGTESLPPTRASPLSPDDQAILEEYKKIVEFRNQVVSGTHPRIKPVLAKSGPDDSYSPPSNVLKASPGAQTTKVNGNAKVVDNSRSYQENSRQTPVNVSAALPGLGLLVNNNDKGAPKSLTSSKPEINPVLLEKSDDLIKAEMRLRRQRLESSLKDQLDQRRAAAKASQQAPEQLSELDLNDVMSQALLLVQKSAAQPTDDTAANPSNGSDSFDDNTFYSSRHDTPETPQISRVSDAREDVEIREDSYEPQLDSPPLVPAKNALAAEPPSPTRDPPLPSKPNDAVANQAPGGLGAPAPYITGAVNNRTEGFQAGAVIEVTSSDGSGPASRSDESGNIGPAHGVEQSDLYRVNRNLLGQALNQQYSPVVRAHNLSPIAPQPEHVSPLAVSRQPAIAQEDASARQATPAQVAALRQQASAGTTPESSPQGVRNDRKRRRKKKKAERSAAEAPAPAAVQSPFIKPEPRSPSPLTAPPYSRPHKRQRPNHSQQPSLNYDEPLSAGGGRGPPHSLRGQTREERNSGNGALNSFGPRAAVQPTEVNDAGYDRSYPLDSRPSYGGPQGTATYATPYGQETRVVQETPYSYQREAPRMSVRPGSARDRSRSPRYDRLVETMPPPRATTRIVVDESGREYMEPTRPATVTRESMVSTGRVGDSELLYERVPARRASSQRPGTLEQDGIVYQRLSPPYSIPPRRMATQPDSVPSEYRTYRERDYSVLPIPRPSEEYGAQRARVITEVPREYITRGGSVRPSESIRYETTVGYERRPLEEPPREYIPTRASSVRPAESIRYEVPVGYERRVVNDPAREYGSFRAASVRPAGYEVYGARFGSVRPEVPQREYAASVHPESRREIIPPPPETASYGMRPYDAASTPQLIRQEYRAPPVEQYYTQAPPRQSEEVVYLERPQQGSYR